MKQGVFLLIVFIIGCSKSTEVKDKIKGRWYFDHEDVFIKITRNQYIVKNDSPVPEDYRFIGDSIIVKGFEASLFPEKYRDTLRVIKLTADTLILRDPDSFLVLHKKNNAQLYPNRISKHFNRTIRFVTGRIERNRL